MSQRAIIALLLTATLSAPAVAATSDKTSDTDPNIHIVTYAPNKRYHIVSTVGHSFVVTFGKGETNFLVVSGRDDPPLDGLKKPTQGEEKVALQNNLPLWAVRVGHDDMQVINNLPDGTQRTYNFSVDVRSPHMDGSEDPEETHGIIFTYPEEARAAAAAKSEIVRARQQEAMARTRLAVDAFYGHRNWRYEAQGRARDAFLAPDEVSDNGEVTTFRWRGNTPKPAIFVVPPGCKDTECERIVSDGTRGDLVTVQKVAAHWRLRADGAVLDVWNRGFDRVGQDPGTGTTSPDVIREVIRASGKEDR